jgi:hypothetical protein
MASCSPLSTGEQACLSPIAASSVVWRLRHFWTIMGLIPSRRAARPHACFTLLYGATDCLCCCGAAVKNLLAPRCLPVQCVTAPCD